MSGPVRQHHQLSLCDDAYFSHFVLVCSIFLYLALRPVDIAMGTMLAVVGVVSLLAIYFL